MISADMLNNKKLNPIITELCIRRRKLNIFLVLLFQNIRLNSTRYFVMKIPNKRELSSHIGFEDFMNLYKKYTAKRVQFVFLVIDTTLVSNNCLCFRNNLLERI